MENTKSGESDASSGEEPNAKRRRRDPNAVHTKTVMVLLDSDVPVSENNANVVLMPNTIEMAQLKKPEKGQFGKMNFTSQMMQMDVLTALQLKFPILRTKRRLGCASAADNRTRLEFHGDKQIWDGALINRLIRGNSALYVFAEENHESEESQVLLEGRVLAATQRLKQLSQMSSVADQIRHLAGNHDEGEPEMLQRKRVELTTQGDRTTGGIWQQGLSVVQKMPNDAVLQDIANPVTQASLKPGSSLQQASPAAAATAVVPPPPHNNVPVEAFFTQTTSTKKLSVSARKRKSHPNGHQELPLPLVVSEEETTDSGIDFTCMLEIGSNHDTVQFRATQENAQNSEPESSLRLALPPPAPAAHKNVPVQVFKQDASSNERKRKDSPQKNKVLEALLSISEGEAINSPTESVWEGSTNLGIVTEISPNKGSTKGGDRFHLIVRGIVPLEIESFKAIFQGGGEVYLEKASLSTLAGKTPGSQHGPGKVRVTLMSLDGSWWGGECDFLYIEDPPTKEELASMVVKDMDMWDKVCDEMLKEISSSKPSDGQTSDSSGKTAPGSSSYAWSVKLLQLLVYKAAQIDGQEFIRMIFSTSAGKVVFNSYRNSASLPEDVASANGHSALANYLQDVNSRLSRESSSDTGTENIDWSELKHAVIKEQNLTSGTDDTKILKKHQAPGYPESDDDESDYFADDEVSLCSSQCHNNASDSENEDHSQISKKSSCEEEVNEEYNLLVENSDSLHLGGDQLEVILSMNAENAGYKHQEQDSDDVESHSSRDDITEKEDESTVLCHDEVENRDTLESEVISAIAEASTGSTRFCIETPNDFANGNQSPTENAYRYFRFLKGEVLVVDLLPGNGSKETSVSVEPEQRTHANNNNVELLLQDPEEQLRDLYNDLRVQATNNENDSSVQNPAEPLRDQDDDAIVHRGNNDGPLAEAPGGETDDDRADPNDVLLQDRSGDGSHQSQVAFKESKPSDPELNDLARKIGTKWQTLGLRLGISQNVLDEIKTNGEDRPYEMLLHWRDATASTTLYHDLYYALCHQRVGLDNAAKEFCVSDSEASAIFDVKFCRSKLAEHYKKTATVPTSVWSKNCVVDIHQIYTRLSWVKEEQTLAGSSRSELQHYTDVFTANKSGVVPKRILVQGQTGIGKSTFVKKLAVDWAELDDTTTGDKQKDILKTFELLVLVDLKEVSKCHSLKDVISRSSIFAPEEKYLTDSLLNHITNNPDKVLLVFDGYDGYRCGRNSEIYEIFRGNELSNCCVVTTTRISKANELRTFKDLHAEITGFGEENRKVFMSRMLGGKADAEDLSRHLVRQNLGDLAKVPLLLLFFCTLWKKGKSKSFPENKTKLYLAIVQCILDHNQKEDYRTRFGKVHDFKEVLAEIGKVALECLLRDHHVFEYDQFSDALLCDESFIVGLLQVTEYTENLRPAATVSFIHKSIQEFLAAWFVTYRCVPEGNLGGIEQHACTLEDCEAWENVLQFVCGLSDDGAVKVFQHLTSVRISDPTLDLSKTISDDENEADVPLSDVTYRQERFSDLVDGSFLDVQSKVALVRHWLGCRAGIILYTPCRRFLKDIPKITLVNEEASCKALFFYGYLDGRDMSILSEVFDHLHVPLRLTDSSAAPLIGDFLSQFKTVGCKHCGFDCVLRFHNGKAQFYITRLEMWCDDHARLFNETIAIPTPSRSANLCSKQSCLKFLRSLRCFCIKNAKNVKDLGAVIRNCKHLKTIELVQCGDGARELLDQVPSPSTCPLSFHPDIAEAEKLTGVLPQINVTALRHGLVDCCAAAVNRLCSITHKTLKELTLKSLGELELTGEDGSFLQAEEMEALFGGINKSLPSVQVLTLLHFNARGSLAALTKHFQFFPNLSILRLWRLNMDEHDLRGLLESLTSFPNLKILDLRDKPLGSQTG